MASCLVFANLGLSFGQFVAKATTSPAADLYQSNSLFVGAGGGGFGTARLTVKGAGATNATNALHLMNSAGTCLFTVRNDGNVGIGTYGFFQPREKLHIHTDGTQEPAIRLERVFNFLGTTNIYAWNITHSFGFLAFQYGTMPLSGVYPSNAINTMSTKMMITNNGNVGIGTTALPQQKLDVQGNAIFSGNVGIGTITPLSKLGITGNASIGATYGAIVAPTSGLIVEGNVGIGTTLTNNPNNYKLTVNGKILCEKIKVIGDVPGADYVFDKDYNLTSLNNLESFIVKNKHLPEVPSADEMKKNGIDLTDMNILLLKKVEELTLHLIEQNKQIEELKKENDIFKEKFEIIGK